MWQYVVPGLHSQDDSMDESEEAGSSGKKNCWRKKGLGRSNGLVVSREKGL